MDGGSFSVAPALVGSDTTTQGPAAAAVHAESSPQAHLPGAADGGWPRIDLGVGASQELTLRQMDSARSVTTVYFVYIIQLRGEGSRHVHICAYVHAHAFGQHDISVCAFLFFFFFFAHLASPRRSPLQHWPLTHTTHKMLHRVVAIVLTIART